VHSHASLALHTRYPDIRFLSLLFNLEPFQMAVTFGSFGDIIAAVQVAAKLLEILSAQRGAKREFRDLIVDLRLYHRFLDQVIFSRNH
jgi:hypothetical protein